MKLIANKYICTNFITGIRAIAILLVFLKHSGIEGLNTFGSTTSEFMSWGQYGVNIFFVVSGFTIFHQICNEKYSLKSFLSVRFLRLSIPYYPLIFLFAAYMSYSGDIFNEWATLNAGRVSLTNILYHLTYFSFISTRYANTIIGVEWTLAIEVFYYICLGVILTSITYNKLSLSSKGLFWVALFLFSFNFQHIVIETVKSPIPISDLVFHFTPFKHGYIFLLGGLAYYIRTFIRYERNKRFFNYLSNIGMVLIPLVVLENLNHHFTLNVDVLYSGLTFILLVIIRDNSMLSIVLNNGLIQFIGKISYSFYLWHFFVLHARLFKLGYFTNPLILFVLKFLISLFLSFCWYFVFEKNIYSRLKSYLLSTRLKRKEGTVRLTTPSIIGV